ncbi:zeta toxin family protein [Xanthomonas phaseoli pv. phaseoli]|uniref:zeta toxin family protein n=1 Tax=Xanthomonas phaseoli TaxID=1985254 RepID=UPI001EEFA600|nr:zeta toxin family protein [Xanthomonas phaseoli]MDM4802487.1 zeta toxin family protein [Xanthomonas phaseoli pv. phaseoli]MDM4806556.1 zeta toxin family protein [Xanthomonas phaseoli pv. phaseoli]MDM4810632.1 zeta toxin family protein [Xanthomonas phaseoli pv. phaseoli]
MSDYALPHDEHRKILNEEIFPDSGLLKKSPFDRPTAIILGGQPGSGKGDLPKQPSLSSAGMQ